MTEKQPYRAFEPSKEERRYLEIRLRCPEPAESPSYAALTNIRGEWRCGQAITLEYGRSMMVIIRGENLAVVYRAIQEWKVGWIAEFDSEEYATPTDRDAPFIKSIAIHTHRPEPPPPMEKRH